MVRRRRHPGKPSNSCSCSIIAEAPPLDPADIPDLRADGHGGPGRNSRLDNRHPANRPFLSAPPPHFPHSQRPVSEHAPSFKRIEWSLPSQRNP